ncbi:hypothetical protein G6F56_010139 [Rhizopus delemar]|nr:hypothetical protein G6F56_010139 [Rhizopus delemar]
MFSKERPLPKALNIIRPSPPPFINTQDSSSTASSPSEISTISNISTFSNSHRSPPATLFNPASLFQNNVNNFKTSSVNTVGVNPHRFLQRPRSNSSLSRSTFFTFSDNHPTIATTTLDENDDDNDDDLDSIDGMTDDEEEEEEEEKTKVVAKMKRGTIMNGKGEFVNKGGEDHDPWSDEARASRKIADLEIENQTLLSLNATLETKLRQQTLQISELEKKLEHVSEAPLTPISDKHVENEDEGNELVLLHQSIEQDDTEAEKSFLRIKSALEGLIEQAEVALIEESKPTAKVLQPQDSYYLKQAKENKRRISDTKPISVKMTRSPSRQSSPPILQQRSASPSIQTRRSTTPSMRRSNTPSVQRPSSRLSTRQTEKPKWSF